MSDVIGQWQPTSRTQAPPSLAAALGSCLYAQTWLSRLMPAALSSRAWTNLMVGLSAPWFDVRAFKEGLGTGLQLIAGIEGRATSAANTRSSIRRRIRPAASSG
jgi:hypothetical protein